jgi:PPK2 family polyphosphate:nucleotide phosphotransferase
MADPHQLTPGVSIRLADIDTDGQAWHSSKKEAEKEFEELRDELIEWQCRLYAEGRQRLLIVLQAMDAGGKDGTIRKVFRGVNPQGVQVTSFKAPTSHELAHDFLWRIHQQVPASGMIKVFNRSHYEDVLIVRVEDLVPEKVWRARYEQINRFERHLVETGTTILKFFLHISKAEQKARFEERIDDPLKHWKFCFEDLAKRKQWSRYMSAYEDALNHCTTDWAPWHVIPADRNWYRNLAVIRVIVNRLRELKPEYPAPREDFSGVKVDD